MMGSWTHRLRTSTLDPTFFAFYISFVSLLYLFMILSTPCLVKLFHAPHSLLALSSVFWSPNSPNKSSPGEELFDHKGYFSRSIRATAHVLAPPKPRLNSQGNRRSQSRQVVVTKKTGGCYKQWSLF